MTTEQPDEKAIFGAALAKESREEREAYLRRVCGGNAELLARLRALLEAHEEAGDFLEQPALGEGVTLDVAPLTEGPGTIVGRYKLLEQIGEGGMGMVYMAEQTEPVRRRVALKIIKLGMDTKQVVARFEAERQALALMDHPNIARVLDAGSTETGRPYFVMDLVRGIPITEYCDKNKLATFQRLELFMQVCRAVQHAHQKGIIHRDIKPSNVMVSLHDGKPVPKVIDFGIAKAMNQRLTEKTLFTGYAQMIGTPAYMSPEQAEMSGLDVDTRSDIYSLGVLLYELLTGTTPLEEKRLRRAGYNEIQRIIREEEPPRPSVRLSTMKETLTSVAAHRGTDPVRLGRLVRDDLDWIVMKALEKDRTRRYETPSNLAEDIRRHLGHEPVTAGPPGAAYRLRKFVGRHQVGVGAGLVVSASLVVGLAAATIGFVRASSESRRAQRAERQALRQRDRAVVAEGEAKGNLARAEAESRRVETLLARTQLDAGLRRLQAGDRFGLLDLLDARASAERNPQLRTSLSLLWSGWHEPWAQRLVSVVGFEGSEEVKAVSPDGELLATVSLADRSMRLRRTETGGAYGAAMPHDARVTHAAFRPDRSILATGTSDGMLRFWDTASGRAHGKAQKAGSRITVLSFSPDGSLLITAAGALGARVPGDGNAIIWDVTAAKPLGPVLTHAGKIGRAAFSHDGSLVVTGSMGGEVKLWRTRTGERLPMPGLRHRKWLIDMTFSLDGKWLATGAADNVVLLANLASGEVRRLHHESWPNALAFSPDSQLLASGSRNGIVRIWKVATGEPYGTPMQTEVARVEELAFSPDGTLLATGTKTGTVRLWSTADCQVHGTPVTHAEDIRELCFTPDGARLFSRVPCGFMMWNVRSTPLSKRTWTHDSHVHAVAFSPDGRRVAVSDRGQIQLRRADTGEPEGLSIDVPQYAVALAFTQGGRRLAGVTLRGDVYRWDVEAGTPPQPAWSLEGVQWGGRRNTAVFGRDGALLATVEEDATRLRRADTGELHGPKGEFKRGGAAAIGPDGKLLVAATYGLDTLLYDIQTGKLLSELHHPEHIRCVTFGPEGKRLAVSVANKRTRVYDVATWRPVGRWMENRGVVYRMAFSPDGKLLAAAEGNVVQLWNLDRGPVPHGTPLPHDGTIFDLTFGPDGQSLLVGSAAGEDGSKGMLTMWQLPAVPADVREMQLRTWLTLGARRGPNRETEAVPWQRSQEYRQELRRLGARRP